MSFVSLSSNIATTNGLFDVHTMWTNDLKKSVASLNGCIEETESIVPVMDESLLVKTKEGFSVVVTPDSQFWVNNKWTTASSLVANDKIMMQTKFKLGDIFDSFHEAFVAAQTLHFPVSLKSSSHETTCHYLKTAFERFGTVEDDGVHIQIENEQARKDLQMYFLNAGFFSENTWKGLFFPSSDDLSKAIKSYEARGSFVPPYFSTYEGIERKPEQVMYGLKVLGDHGAFTANGFILRGI